MPKSTNCLKPIAPHIKTIQSCGYCSNFIPKGELLEIFDEKRQSFIRVCEDCLKMHFRPCASCQKLTNVLVAQDKFSLVCFDCYASEERTVIKKAHAHQICFLRN